jgi:hypothetical protein
MKLGHISLEPGVGGGAVGRGNALQGERSRVRFIGNYH